MRARQLFLGVMIAAGLVCGGSTAWRVLHPDPVESAHAAPLEAVPATAEAPAGSPWLAAHFPAALAAQGPAPAGWSPIEGSLSAKDCGACHVQELAAWRTSRHALAMGPGVLGQHVEGGVAECVRCHAPLAEQGVDAAAGASLASEGVNCAGCHVRGWEHSGPPRAAEAVVVEGAPHGGFTAMQEYTDPAFCASCHDFSAAATPVAGKKLQETTEEWRRTPAAAAGTTCQGCHMPAGAHSWAGAHDLDAVRSAFSADARFITDGGLVVGRLRVTATEAVGHRLPTYTTAELWLTIDQLDHEGLILDGTHREGVIGRRLSSDNTEELFDTRLFPGEMHDLLYQATLEADCTTLFARVEMRPEAAYERRYADWIAAGIGDATQLTAALEAAKAARFVAWQERVALPE